MSKDTRYFINCKDCSYAERFGEDSVAQEVCFKFGVNITLEYDGCTFHGQ